MTIKLFTEHSNEQSYGIKLPLESEIINAETISEGK